MNSKTPLQQMSKEERATFLIRKKDRAAVEYREAIQVEKKNSASTILDALEQELALFLLYGSDVNVEDSPVQLPSPADMNKVEEAASLLLGLNKKKWDKFIMQHLKQALLASNQLSTLISEYERAPALTLRMPDRWICLAECHSEAGNSELALSLCRKFLHPNFSPNHTFALLLAAKLCASLPSTFEEGASYSERALQLALEPLEKAAANRYLGLNLARHARVVRFPEQRKSLISQAQTSFRKAIEIEGQNSAAALPLALILAEEGNLSEAMVLVKSVMKAGKHPPPNSWRLLVLLLTCQKQWTDAISLCDSVSGGITAKGADLSEAEFNLLLDLLQIKALILTETKQASEAVLCHKRRLHMLSSLESKKFPSMADQSARVWFNLSLMYSSQQQFSDARLSASKCAEVKSDLPLAWHCLGFADEKEGELEQALVKYRTALAIDPDCVLSNVQAAGLLRGKGQAFLPIADLFLSRVLEVHPHSPAARACLGEVQRDMGLEEEAAASFQEASRLKETCPVADFDSFHWVWV